MNRIASVFFFVIAFAVVLGLGIPCKASASINDNGTHGRLILAGIGAGFDVGGVGAGAGIGSGGAGGGAHIGGLGVGAHIGDRNRYNRERAYRSRAAAHRRAVARRRAAERYKNNHGTVNQTSTDR